MLPMGGHANATGRSLAVVAGVADAVDGEAVEETKAGGRRLSPDDRRAQLVASALGLLKTSSLDGLNATTVSMAAGVSKGLVFHYFPTQRELQAAVADAAASEIIAALAGTDPSLSHGTRLRAGIEAFVAYIEQQPETYAAIARDSGTDGLLRAVVDRTRHAVIDLVAGAVGVAELAPAARLYLLGWMALVEETTVQWVLQPAVSRDELIDHLEATARSVLQSAARRPE